MVKTKLAAVLKDDDGKHSLLPKSPPAWDNKALNRPQMFERSGIGGVHLSEAIGPACE